MTPTKISVIIPVYNTAPYLRRCLDSVTGQTLRDIEIICVNDGSTDNCADILSEYAAKDTRMRVFNNDNNVGVSKSRNLALAEAGGEYISFVDSDDAIDENFLEKLYDNALATHADIVKGERCTVDYDGKKTFSTMNNAIIQNGKTSFKYEFTTAIYSSEMLKDNKIIFPDSLTNYEDVVFLIRALLKANKISCVENTYYVYFRRHDSAHTLFLNDKKTSSILQAKQIIIEEINNEYPLNISDSDYDMLFYSTLKKIIPLSFRNDSQYCKQRCSEAMLKIYNQSKRLSVLNDKIYNDYPNILYFLRAGNICALIKFLTINNSHDQLRATKRAAKRATKRATKRAANLRERLNINSVNLP